MFHRIPITSNKIDIFLDEKSDQLIKDWELTETMVNILILENRYTQVSDGWS